MKLLFDTHAFLWWDSADPRLSPAALAPCRSGANTLHLSIASIWEMQIKLQLGKLALITPLAELLRSQPITNQIVFESIEVRHILALGDLPSHHRDPFDRMLVAQARVDGFHLVTSDREIARYDVPIIW